MEDLSTMGKRIRHYRKQQELTQKQLAKKVGVNEVTIRSYEADKYQPKYDTLCRLCESLFVFPEDLKDLPGVNRTITKDGVEITSVDTANIIPQELVKHYTQLNDKGKKEAVKRVSELTQIPKYQKDKE